MPTPRAPRPSRPARLAAAALASLAVLFTSCGDDGGSSERAETVRESTTTTTAAGNDADEPAADGEERDAEVETELEQRALEVGDLPTGWSVSPEDDDESDDDGDESDMGDECGLEDDILPDDVEPLAEVEREFQKSEIGPFVFVSLTRFPGGRAEEAMAALNTMVQECREYTSTDEDGMTMRGTFGPLSFPERGDQTFAARMSVDAQGMTGQGDLVAVRKGDHVVLMMGLSMSTFLGAAPFVEGEYLEIVDAAVGKALD